MKMYTKKQRRSRRGRFQGTLMQGLDKAQHGAVSSENVLKKHSEANKRKKI